MDPNDQNQQGPADDSAQGDAAGVGGGSDDAPTPSPAGEDTPVGGGSGEPSEPVIAPPSPAPSDENGGEEPGPAPAA